MDARWALLAIPLGLGVGTALLRREPPLSTLRAHVVLEARTLLQPEEAPASAQAEPHEPLHVAFASDDVAIKVDAIEGAVREVDVAAVPVLAAVDLKREPEAAPSIIRGIATLAQTGNREVAVAALSRWLESEMQRSDRDAQGNVVNLVEALGDLGEVKALIDALDSKKLDLSVETLAVQKLGVIGDRRAEQPILRFDARIKDSRGEDDFEEQLRREAQEAVRSSLASLR